MGNALTIMKKVLLFLVSLSLALPVFGVTREELLTQLETLEGRARVIEGHLKLIEGGGQTIRSKQDLLTDLAVVKGDVERVKSEIAALPVVPVVDSFSPQEALPGSEVVVRGFEFRTNEGNYAVIRHGNGPGDAIALPVTVVDSQTAKFSLPADYALFGTYRTSVFMAGAGESNTKNFQVLKPVAVGGAAVPTGVAGVITAAVTGITNIVGNLVNTTPTPASPTQVLPSVSIESVEPQELNAGGTLTVRGRNLSFDTSYKVFITDTITNQTQEFSARTIQGATGITLEVDLPQSLRAGQYQVAVKSQQFGTSNTRALTLLDAAAPPPAQSPPPSQTTPPPAQPPPQEPPTGQQIPSLTLGSVQPQGGDGALTTGVTGDGGLSVSNPPVSVQGQTQSPPTTPPPNQPPPASPPPASPPPSSQPPPATSPPAGTPPPPPTATAFTLGGLLTRAEGILNLIIPFIIGLAVFVIIWGIFLYVTKAAEEEKRSEARLYIVWGIVAVFCMLSLWGFVNILVNSFDLQTTFDKGSVPTAPTL